MPTSGRPCHWSTPEPAPAPARSRSAGQALDERADVISPPTMRSWARPSPGHPSRRERHLSRRRSGRVIVLGNFSDGDHRTRFGHVLDPIDGERADVPRDLPTGDGLTAEVQAGERRASQKPLSRRSPTLQGASARPAREPLVSSGASCSSTTHPRAAWSSSSTGRHRRQKASRGPVIPLLSPGLRPTSRKPCPRCARPQGQACGALRAALSAGLRSPRAPTGPCWTETTTKGESR